MPSTPEQARVMLSIPTYRSVSSMAFASAVATIADSINTGCLAKIVVNADMYVTMARNKACDSVLRAADTGITHLWMIDDDMVVPPGALAALLARDLPVVGAAYYTKDLRPVAYTLEPFAFLQDVPAAGLLSVEGLGAGCLLVTVDVIRRMREHFRDDYWWQNQVIRVNGEPAYLGEDVFFFHRLKEMGIAAYMDCDVQCGHVGQAVADRGQFEAARRAHGR